MFQAIALASTSPNGGRESLFHPDFRDQGWSAASHTAGAPTLSARPGDGVRGWAIEGAGSGGGWWSYRGGGGRGGRGGRRQRASLRGGGFRGTASPAQRPWVGAPGGEGEESQPGEDSQEQRGQNS
ncbi:hypothetical protein KUDE01_019635 [Dissostichus eleginoides]|uniref:Uncharacterized protein n=1 Tax=Dissostichus eleginoides TaxID=100907 RepID=A0AAD9C3G1_DISEL|nr:hypothetical protein KUDE01_019635 [Dissostichus eleginoides]